MSTFLLKIMPLRKAAYILSVSLLIVCYAATIPVLAVFHNHAIQGQSLVSEYHASEKPADSKTDLPFCAICFRVSTTHAFVDHQTNAAVAVIHHAAFVPHTTCPFDVVDRQSFQGRAPPFQTV